MSSTHGSPGADALPPFPEDVPTCPLFTLSLKKLVHEDEGERQRLMKACEQIGFFYLDLRDAPSDILRDADRIFDVAAELFDLPLFEKQQYDYSGQNSYFGYKSKGAVVIDEKRNVDRNESYNVSRDEIMGLDDPRPMPQVLIRNMSTIQTFMMTSHYISTLILREINEHMGLPPNTLAKLHRMHVPSGDLVRIIKAVPHPADGRGITLPAHTDYGSVTVLFNRLGGLQVLTPGSSAWTYVKPLPGHAIVNIGDSLVKFTNGILRSNFHRIVSPPGAQADVTRYSVLYFCRPNDDVVLRPLVDESERIRRSVQEGPVADDECLTSKEWILKRALGRRTKNPTINFDEIAGTEPVRGKDLTA